ncbi:amidohydrolase family protein [Dactylosporangium sp. AC04546]|uniref:amidohydrolase family protein n=1 Tax=Dactylosporangium sp. AC04546 TaxID=2862460 RepID=UPI001EDE0A23|nr:amidohydrolase family protein [Dactylosporangium sp. AC04546]WVK85978.1 amidohydrolase family protein [Dactylosporangium sp. AC04546]
MIVDAHHHLWDVDGGYDWLDAPELAPIRRTFAPGQLRAELAAAGVSRSVLVEGGRCDADEAAVLLEHASATSEIAAVVAWADPADPDLDTTLAGYRALDRGGHLKGIRAQVQAEDAGYLDRADVRAGLARIGAAGLVFDLVVRAEQLPSAGRAAAALPGVRFVLDHLGKPRIRAGAEGLAEWRALVAGLAACPNVSAKLSGLVTEADWADWEPADLRPYVEEALALFGPDRLMFGSDWPVCTLAASYGEVIDTLDGLIGPGDRASVFGGTATAVYGLERDTAETDRVQSR